MDEQKEILKQLLKQVLENADQFTTEELLEIVKIFKRAVEIIDEQREQIPTSTTPAPEIPSGPYPSSNVEGFNYDPKSGKLQVQFHGPYPQAKGSIYEYDDVPEYIYDIFSRGAVGPRTSGKNRYHEWIKGVTPSLGGSLNALLKGGKFNYRRVS